MTVTLSSVSYVDILIYSASTLGACLIGTFFLIVYFGVAARLKILLSKRLQKFSKKKKVRCFIARVSLLIFETIEHVVCYVTSGTLIFLLIKLLIVNDEVSYFILTIIVILYGYVISSQFAKIVLKYYYLCYGILDIGDMVIVDEVEYKVIDINLTHYILQVEGDKTFLKYLNITHYFTTQITKIASGKPVSKEEDSNIENYEIIVEESQRLSDVE